MLRGRALQALSPLFLAQSLLAQDRPRVLVPPSHPTTHNILFVVDCSDSLGVDGARQALSGVRFVSSQPFDDLHFGILAFGRDVARWEPSEETRGEAPDGWSETGEEAIEEALAWLASGPVDSTSTVFTDPLVQAFREPVDDLTVILVTDGHYREGESGQALVSLLRGLQVERFTRDMEDAIFGVWQVGFSHTAFMWLSVAAREGRGGLVRTE